MNYILLSLIKGTSRFNLVSYKGLYNYPSTWQNKRLFKWFYTDDQSKMKESQKLQKPELVLHYEEIIKGIGENISREGLEKTPLRAAKSMQFLTQGYQQDPVDILKSALFKESYSEMVIVRDIELYSLCEHHILPFFGKAHVAYIPNGYIVGLSKIPRLVDVFARRLQVQERLTTEILNCLDSTLKPHGAAVVIEACHMCMMMRGVQKQNSLTTTSAFTGVFKTFETRNEFLNLLRTKS